MDIAITKMSSKGQVVIPAEMRKDFHEGEKLIVFESEGKIIMQKASKMSEKLKEDLEFARRTEEAWKEYERGKFTSMPAEEFLKKLEKWAKG